MVFDAGTGRRGYMLHIVCGRPRRVYIYAEKEKRIAIHDAKKEAPLIPAPPCGRIIRACHWSYAIDAVISCGRRGMAPCCVHTYAEVVTAISCARRTERPASSAAQKPAVKESPAPTVSATSTRGVGSDEVPSAWNTSEYPRQIRPSISFRLPFPLSLNIALTFP